MSLYTLISEFFRFLKDNIKKIILSTMAVMLVMVGLRLYASKSSLGQDKAAYELLKETYANEAAGFSAVIYDFEDKLYDNSFLIDEYFQTEEVLEELEKDTSINIKDVLEAQDTLELYKTSNYRGSIAALRDTSSSVITFRFQVGKTSQENLEISKFYENLLASGKVPFLQNSEVKIFKETALEPYVSENYEDYISRPRVLNVYNKATKKSYIIYAILGLILGFILSFVILVVIRIFKEDIVYAFEYSWELKDSHYIIDDISSLEEMVTRPLGIKRLVLSQGNIAVVEDNSNTLCIESINLLDDASYLPEEIVLIINENTTTKAWYNEQLTISRLYKVPVKVIHVRKEGI